MLRKRFISITDLLKECKVNQKSYYLENKASYIITFSICAFISAFFIALFISLCFFNNSTPMRGTLVSTGYQLLAAIFFFGLIFVMYKGLSAFWNLPVFAKSGFAIRLIVMSTVLFAVQMVLVVNLHTTIGWDVWNMVHYATAAASHNPIESFYISMYPNNLMLFFILFNIIKFLNFIGFTNYWLWFAVINVIFVDIAIIAAVITFQKIYPSFKRMYLLFIILSLLVGLSPWIIVLYSDTVLMPVISLLVLFCVLTVLADNTVKRITYSSVAGILFAFGWLIKPTVIAVAAALVGIGIIYIFQLRGRIKPIYIYIYIATILISGICSFIISMSLFNVFVDNQNIIIIDKTLRTPASYAIATGLFKDPAGSNRFRYGAYNPEVSEINFSGTTDERNEEFIEFIKDKLNEYGPVGYAAFLFNKARWITSEGYFSWLSEAEAGIGLGSGDFHNPDRNVFKALLYPDSRFYPIYMNLANGLWIVVFFGICAAMTVQCFKGFGKERLKSNFDLFLQFIIFFGIAAILLTEARSRYLLGFLPAFCVVSVSGYSYIGKFFKLDKK